MGNRHSATVPVQPEAGTAHDPGMPAWLDEELELNWARMKEEHVLSMSRRGRSSTSYRRNLLEAHQQSHSNKVCRFYSCAHDQMREQRWQMLRVCMASLDAPTLVFATVSSRSMSSLPLPLTALNTLRWFTTGGAARHCHNFRGASPSQCHRRLPQPRASSRLVFQL